MNASQLASMMLEWEEMRRRLDVVEGNIKAAVLEVGQTQTVGRARATYTGGRKTYDYEAAAKVYPFLDPAVVEENSKVVVDWRAVCGAHTIPQEKVPFTQSEPSVTLKLLG
jgi:hypothetical protein